MKHAVREDKGVVIFELVGKIMGGPDDTAIVNEIYECADQNKVKIVLDLCKVEWMNSRGLGICIAAVTSLRNRGGDLRMACTSGKVQELLDKSRMFEVFKSYPSVDDAVNSYQ
jgi:anti-sigma B factor antagonist